MPYTLIKFLLWAVAFFAAGMLIGWLLRSLTCRAQVASARAADPADDDAAALRMRIAELERELASSDDELASRDADPSSTGDQRPEAGPLLDEATAVIGVPVHLDDLTVVEGIGPKVAELCRALGIHTWRDLADTEVSTLRSMLDDAGARFRLHDPASWPEQAQLLADGRWSAFRRRAEDRPETP